MSSKPNKNPLDKVLGRLDDLDQVNLGILVQRLARERKLLETVFDVIRDGILVLDEEMEPVESGHESDENND